MGDEVTKKDLQALQANVNRQIAELARQLAALKKEFNRGLDDENQIAVNAKADVMRRIDQVDARLAGFQNAINTVARAVSDVAKKVGT